MQCGGGHLEHRFQSRREMAESEIKVSASGLSFELHPLVLLNISDHHTRIQANGMATNSGSVYGILLGQQLGREISISNSFELQVQEASSSSPIIVEAYLDKKLEQYKQTFSSLDVVGWYATGKQIHPHMMDLHRRVMQINESGAFLLFNTNLSGQEELPVYLFESEFHTVQGSPQSVFVKANYTVQTTEAERIAVKQVASTISADEEGKAEQLSAHYSGLHAANQMLVNQIQQLAQILHQMASGKIPVNHGLLREVASLLRRVPIDSDESFNEAYRTEVNDAMLTILMGNLTQGCNSVLELVDKCDIAYTRR